jgi:hypothetical protein
MRCTLFPALALLAIPCAPAATPAQTAMFRGGPEHTGI